MFSNPPNEPPNPPSKRAPRFPIGAGLYRYSVAWCLGVLVLVFVTAPFVQIVPNGQQLEALAITVLLLTAVFAVGGRRRSLLVAMFLATPVVIGRWLYHVQPEDNHYWFFVASFLLFIGFVVGRFLHFILRSPRVTSEVLCAAVSVYLMLALFWAVAYALVARLIPNSFSGLPPGGLGLQGFDALYFSAITLTTVGFGDITPVSSAARMLAMLEAITGTIYLTVLVARLVSLYSTEAAVKDAGGQ